MHERGAFGTNIGLRAVAAGQHSHSEDEIRYVRPSVPDRPSGPRHRHRDRERHLHRPAAGHPSHSIDQPDHTCLLQVASPRALDRFADAIAAMLDEDPSVAATKTKGAGVRGIADDPQGPSAPGPSDVPGGRAHQRTSYEPGELGQTDWWEPGITVPVGRGQSRQVFGLVTGLPFSAAFRVVFAFNQTVAAFCPALVGGLARLGGLPKAMVSDNDACIVAHRRGGLVTLVDEVAALYGQLLVKPAVLRPYFPQGKGFIERMNQYLETSFLPLRSFTCIQDLQQQADAWSVQVADRRHSRPPTSPFAAGASAAFLDEMPGGSPATLVPACRHCPYRPGAQRLDAARPGAAWV